MSEYINNSRKKIDTLKELILTLHNGSSVDETKKQIEELLGEVPYGDVVAAEQELINEGLDPAEILQLCDLHSGALKGSLNSQFSRPIPSGHPVETILNENIELNKLCSQTLLLIEGVEKLDQESLEKRMKEVKGNFNLMMDVEKHYQRKENLIFPFLEKYEITGPPMVMWGKDDEVRAFLKSSQAVLRSDEKFSAVDFKDVAEMMLVPAIKAVQEMIYKEDKILMPMCVDTLSEIDWYEVYQQSNDYGYCLYTPENKWKPNIENLPAHHDPDGKRIQLSTGSFSVEELEGVFNSLPFDITFVDKDDKVKYFSHGLDRIFQRSKAILGREVQYCHPPSSVHVVDNILNDFKTGKQNSAKFWINFQNKFVHIAYYPVRDEDGNYMGTVEVSQDLTEYRSLEGERRILQYDNENKDGK